MDITDIPVGNQHAYLISVLDGYSRYIIHSKLSFIMRTGDVKEVLSRALFKSDLYEVPDSEKTVLISDNGTQFVSNNFRTFLKNLDIDNIRTAVDHPETNGKIEAFHKTLKHENIYIKDEYSSFYEAKEDIKEFINKYNKQRLNQGVEFVTPYQKYTGKDKEIMKERKENHQAAIKRRKRLNKSRAFKAA